VSKLLGFNLSSNEVRWPARRSIN